MDITLLIASIGCFTGITSLLITILKFLNERVKLKVVLKKGIYFSQYHSDKSKLYDFIGNFTFINNSSMPITIYSIDFTDIKDKKIYHNKNCYNREIKLTTVKHLDKSYSVANIPMDNQINFPLRIDPFDAVIAKVYIPRVRVINAEQTYTFKATIKTPRKSISESYTFEKYVIKHKNRACDEDCDPPID